MTREEYSKFTKELENRGYRQYSSYNNADETWYKAFGKGNNPYDEDRSLYQIAFSIWDFSKYIRRDEYIKENPYSGHSTIMVSRTIDERVDLELGHVESNDDVERVEKLGESFMSWVSDNIKIRKTE
jgi:hypothetical protein